MFLLPLTPARSEVVTMDFITHASRATGSNRPILGLAHFAVPAIGCLLHLVLLAAPSVAQPTPKVPSTARNLSAAAEQAAAPPGGQNSAPSERASEVRLQGVTTLGEALEAISLESGIQFRHRTEESTPVAAVEGPLTFWRSLDEVLDQTDLDIDYYAGDRQTLRLIPRSRDRPSRVASAVYPGVYRIEPQSVTARRVLSRPRLSSLQVSLEIAWEPRLTPIGLTIPIEAITGELEDGTKLEVQESGGSIDVATNQEIASTEFFLPLKLPDSESRMIARLEGQIHAILPDKTGRFELSLGDPTAKQTLNDMTVQIEGVRRTGELVEVRLGIELDDAGRSLESHRQWIFENQVLVRHPDGNESRHLGMEVYRQTLGGVGIGYLFDLSGSLDDLQLVYESPTAVNRDETTFILRDVPLP